MRDKKIMIKQLERLVIVLNEIMPGCAELVRDAIFMLKEQEAKPVKIVKNVYNHEFYYCPNCDRQFYGCYKRPAYCDRCGQAVKWDG